MAPLEGNAVGVSAEDGARGVKVTSAREAEVAEVS